jgi:polyisoprenoid-binding protein YceI
MKKIQWIAVVSLLSSMAFAAEPPSAGVYAIDADHSKVSFEVSHLVIATVEGQFNQFEGKITIDADFSKSSLEATIQTASIDTANEDRDKHLQADDFFDAKKHPQITFRSTLVSGTPQNFEIVGDLTMKGVTRSVTLKGRYNGTVKDPWGNTKAGFRASTTVDRRDFGLTWSKMIEAGPVVGDEVNIELRIEAKLQK